MMIELTQLLTELRGVYDDRVDTVAYRVKRGL